MSINKTILLGRTCKDVDYKEFPNGGASASVTLVTNKRAFKMSNGTEVPEKATYHYLVFHGGYAKVAQEHVKKGKQIYIEGENRDRTYTDKNGVERTTREIIVNKLELL